MTYKPTTPPPCIFCGHEATTDVTPPNEPPLERHYECPNCLRKFALKFTPIPPPSSDEEPH